MRRKKGGQNGWCKNIRVARRVVVEVDGVGTAARLLERARGHNPVVAGAAVLRVQTLASVGVEDLAVCTATERLLQL